MNIYGEWNRIYGIKQHITECHQGIDVQGNRRKNECCTELIVEKWNQMMFQAHKICLQRQKGSIQLQEINMLFF
jgi:hypothetical protein